MRHRVVHLWILNSLGQLLVQQRSADKDAGANLWYTSVAGHIESGESIEDTLVRESMEELGLDISGMIGGITYLYTFTACITENNGSFRDNEIYDVFALKADFDIKNIVMQREEVQAVQYLDYDRFKKIVRDRDPSFWQHPMGYDMLIIALGRFLKGMV